MVLLNRTPNAAEAVSARCGLFLNSPDRDGAELLCSDSAQLLLPYAHFLWLGAEIIEWVRHNLLERIRLILDEKVCFYLIQGVYASIAYTPYHQHQIHVENKTKQKFHAVCSALQPKGARRVLGPVANLVP